MNLRGLEVILQSELDDSCNTDSAEDLSEIVRIGNVVRGRTKARVVGEVKELRPEIEIVLLRNIELLADTKIPVGQGRRSLAAVPSIPERAQAVQHIGAANTRTANQPLVRALTGCLGRGTSNTIGSFTTPRILD